MKKRVTSAFLSLVMLFALLPASAFAVDTLGSGYCGGEGNGQNLTWTLYEDGTLYISGTGKMKNYQMFYSLSTAPWCLGHDSQSYVTSVFIDSGVTSIGDYAFRGQRTLTSVSIPQGITSIGDRAFADCSELAGSIVIPEGVTGIGLYAFSVCPKLESVTIPASATNLGMHPFSDSIGLKSITVAEGNTAYSSDERGVLFNKAQTELIQYPAGNAATSYMIPSSVTTITDYSFAGASHLAEVAIPESVTAIGTAAFIASGLTEVSIPSGVNSIDAQTFCNCSKLESVTIPSNVMSIGTQAFSDCPALKNVMIEEGVQSIGYCAFYQCSGLTDITIPASVNSIDAYAFYYCRKLSSIMIPEGVPSIGNWTFYECRALSSIVIPSSLTSVGYSAFDYSGLTDVYYIGSEADWNTFISSHVGLYNNPLRNAEVHFNWSYPSDDECKVYSDLPITWRSEADKERDMCYFGSTGLEFQDQWLLGNSTVYNHDLARMSIGMAMAGYEARTEHEQKSSDANIRQLYLDMGFDGGSFYSSGYGAQDDDSIAFAIATKQVSGETLMALTLRGGGYGDGGWAGNFQVGGYTILHSGFGKGMVCALGGLKNYLAEHSDIETEHLHIWLTGFSRSAAVANLLAVAIMNNGLCKKSNLFAYTFATPSSTADSTRSYNNIFNIINPMDIVPEVPPIQWSFGKYGNTYQIPTVSVSASIGKDRFEEKFTELTGRTYRAGEMQEVSVDYLIGVICTLIPSAQKYHDKYENALVSLKKDSSPENKEAILNELLFGNILTISDLKKCIAADLFLDHHKLWLTLQEAIIIASVKNYEVYQLLSELAVIALQAQYEAATDAAPVCGNLLNMILDLLEQLLGDQASSSELLLQHWQEVYLAWMLTADGERITQTNEFRVARIACPVNVEVYDEAGNLVGRTKTDSFTVEDEEGNEETYTVSVIDEEVTTLEAAVFGETKTFILPEGENYSIRIVTNENYSEGDTMTVSISDYSNGSQVAGVVYEDVALSEVAQFDAAIGDAVEMTDQAQTVIEPTQAFDLSAHTTAIYDAEVLREGNEYLITGTAAPREADQLLVCTAYSENGQYLASDTASLHQSQTEAPFSLTISTEAPAAKIKAFLVDPQSYAPLENVTSLLNLQW